MTGDTVVVGSVPRLAAQLKTLNEATWCADVESVSACNAGAAIDLLNKAGESLGVVIFRTDDAWGSAGWFYQRRSGYVHERIAPVFTVDGLLHIDTDLLSQKRPGWSDSIVSARELTGLIDELFVLLTSNLATGWQTLHATVRKIDPPKPTPASPDVQFSFASPRRPVG